MALQLRRRGVSVVRRLGWMAWDGQRAGLYLVTMLLVVSGGALLLDLLMEQQAAAVVADQVAGLSWETPPPLPVLSRHLRLYSSDSTGILGTSGGTTGILGTSGGSTMDSAKFQTRILARQVEMQQLIRNISASMQSNPLVQKIQASRAAVRYKVEEGLEGGLWVDPTLRRHRGRDATWQPVNGTRHKFFVYSAFYDDREKPLVRVVAATKTKKSDKVWCKLYYSDRQPVLVQAGIGVIRENWNLQYSAAFVTCDLLDRATGAYRPAPQSLSLVAKLNLAASNQLPVHYSDTGIRPPVTPSLGVCVKPLHFQYNKSLELLQFLEMNRLLGVTRFTMYNDTVGEEVACLLRHYQHQGLLEVLPWRLDITSQKEIRTEGLFAALNDCLYRNMNKFKYLMLIDLDELVIPHQNKTLLDLLADLRTRTVIQAGKPLTPSQVSSYSFQNGFFYLQWPDSPSSPTSPPLTALLKTRRRQKLHPPKQRSKYICSPGAVKEAGNHFIWEFHHGKTLNVPPSLAFLHHYRVCEFGGDDCVHNPHVEDGRVPEVWGSSLLARVTREMEVSSCSRPDHTTLSTNPTTPAISSQA